jgi:hypothetical protein
MGLPGLRLCLLRHRARLRHRSARFALRGFGEIGPDTALHWRYLEARSLESRRLEERREARLDQLGPALASGNQIGKQVVHTPINSR